MSEKIKQMIINSPYEEPNRYWCYNRDTKEFDLCEGRRPSGYFIARKGAERDDGVFVELELVNRIRSSVREWRMNDYPEVTEMTRRLIYHWNNRNARPDTPFFFCQLDAIETLIFLSETHEGRSILIPNDGSTFRRICTKLCTGGGKTIVMAMLIAWHVCNSVCYPRDKKFTKNILIATPNLTVKRRLEVMKTGGTNYYDRFEVLPSEVRHYLSKARIEIHNWQKFLQEKTDSKSVVKIPPKSDNAYCRGIIGDMKNVLVINDEAHHAWRIKPEDNQKEQDKSEREEATVWVSGLDRIDRARKILTCYDFSATPFVPGRGRDEEGLFEWIVSDFGLSDGVESGIVKTPRLPARDNTPPDSRTHMSKFWHIFADEDVKKDLGQKKQKADAPLPELVRNAYMFLCHDWKETFELWQKKKSEVPPVMITVASNTDAAARIENYFLNGNSDVPELSQNVIRIDSSKLEKLDTEDAERLRETADTVGKEGKAGEQIRNVISVSMLSEGWDTRTVTHIMGLRSFTSQLLCEQVVGRGLRRTSYDVPPEGEFFSSEYVNIFGVPFSFLPFDVTDSKNGSGGIINRTYEVKVLPERREYAITWPNVERLEYVMTQKLVLDVNDVPEMILDAADTALNADIAPVIDGKMNLAMCSNIDLEKIYASIRMQTLMFKAADIVYEEMKANTLWQKQGVKLSLIGQVIRVTEEYLRSGKVKIYPALFETDIMRRKILLALNMESLIRNLWSSVRSVNTEEIKPVLYEDKRERSTEEMPDWRTSRPNEVTLKSHINRCVYDSTWEASEAYCLDHNPDVKAWVKNDHLGFHVNYIFEGRIWKYYPDFLIKLSNDRMLILEVKGIESEQDRIKRKALNDWVKAVNGTKRFGEWSCDVSYNPADVDGIISKHIRKGDVEQCRR